MQTRTPDNVLKHLNPEFFRNRHITIVSHARWADLNAYGKKKNLKMVDVYNTEITIYKKNQILCCNCKFL